MRGHPFPPCAWGLAALLACLAFAAAFAQPTVSDESLTAAPSLFPVDDREVATFALTLVTLTLAAGAGLGGGALLVAVYLLVLRAPHAMVAGLANSTILGGAVANIVFNLGARHPLANRPMIDWNLIMLMEPATMLGAIVGSFAHQVVNARVSTVLLVALLAVVSARTFLKAWSLWQDSAAGADERPPTDAEASGGKGTGDGGTGDGDYGALLSGSDTGSRDGSETGSRTGSEDGQALLPAKEAARRLQAIRATEARLFPPTPLSVVASLSLAMLSLDASKLGVACGSALYWSLTLVAVPVALGVSVWARAWLLRDNRSKARVNYKFARGDVRWTTRTSVLFPVVCSVAGLAAGMFGVGGGIVKSPLMLEMGLLPDVVAATSATMILFTSAVCVSSNIVYGAIAFDYAALLFALGFVGTFAGRLLLRNVGNRRLKNVVITFAVGVVIALSAACIFASMFGADYRKQSLCEE
jgi:uncharacterized membrane protein YfcA